MALAPQVTARTDKATYRAGEPVTVTFTVAADTRDQSAIRTVNFTGHDDEGNAVNGTIATTVVSQVPDGFTLDTVTWADTGVRLTVSGLQATGTA